MLKLIVISAITSCLAACVVDDNSTEWAQSSQPPGSSATRFAEAAQKACGPNSAWEPVVGGVQCYTHRGARTGKVVQP